MAQVIKRKTQAYTSAMTREFERDSTHPYKITCPTYKVNALRFQDKSEADREFQRIKDQGIHQAIYTYSYTVDNFNIYKVIGYAGGINAENN